MGWIAIGHDCEAGFLVNVVAIIKQSDQLAWLDALGAIEVVLYHHDYSREGGIAEHEIEELAQKAQAQKFKVAIQIDRLLEENAFQAVLDYCLSCPVEWNLRVQDLGLAQALYENKRAFSLILEAGHANLNAIKNWCDLLEGPLQRVVLNNEIPKRNLHPILDSLNLETETLGFGALVMYYTPRSLLTHSGNSKQEGLIQSDEMGPGQYRLVESTAGTVMYYNKDLSLLRYVDELEQAGLTHLRLDLREVNEDQVKTLVESLKQKSDSPFKESWSRPLLHGFYGENKSDSVFDRLSTKQVDWEREPFAEVIDQTKSRLLVRTWIENLELPLKLSAKDGKGRWHEWEVEQVETLKDRQVKSVLCDEVFFIQRPRKFASGTLLYRG